MNRFSLRTRLVAPAVVLVAFAVTLVGVATYLALHSYLSNQLQEQLQDVLSRPRLAICSQDATGGGGPTYPSGQSFSAALVDSTNGTVTQFSCTGSVKLAGNLPLSDDQGRLLADTPRQYFSVHTASGGYLATVVPSDRGLVAVGVSTADVDGTLNRLVTLELIIGAAAVVATAILGLVGVRL